MKPALEAALAATRATLLDGATAPHELRVSTDTRTLEPGDTFLALQGERFDGHHYAEEAVRRGAAMLIVSSKQGSPAAGVPTMVVESTLPAYMALASLAREQFAGRVIAITGSAGKTTTKVFLTQLLAVRYGSRVLAAPANENNEIGVSKLLLGASNDEHDAIVVEMGARRYGDVAELVAIARPGVGILTNIGEAHLEIMGSRTRLEETKWALFSGGARAVLNSGDAASAARAPSLAGPVHWFTGASARPSTAALRASAHDDKVTVVRADGVIDAGASGVREYAVEVRVPGWHNRANLAAALAGALELDVPLEPMLAIVPALQLPAGRYDRVEVAGGMRVIYDAYNANASSMIAALDAFAGEAAQRRIAVLSSMAELGEESEVLHERVGAHAAARVDVLLVGGEFAQALARGAQRAGLASAQIVHVDTNAHAARWLREHAHRDDVVLLKGSRKYKLEEIVEELRS